MRQLHETFARRASYPLVRRIGRHQLWVLLLDDFELVHQRVKFRVTDLRLVKHVIKVLVMTNVLAQPFDFALNTLL